MKTLFLLIRLIPAISLSACATTGAVCSDGWKVTGYYSPVEAEYPDLKNQTVIVTKEGVVRFNRQFLRDVKMEGWGRTRFGWYLGFYSNQWHKSQNPLDARGNPLQIGAIAVDRKIVKQGSVLNISGLESVLGISSFIATDTGGAIKQKHVDIYTGEGKQAQKHTWAVSGQQRVCVASL